MNSVYYMLTYACGTANRNIPVNQVNTMAVDALATQGAMASTGMVFTDYWL